jgi:hypothetical protein
MRRGRGGARRTSRDEASINIDIWIWCFVTFTLNEARTGGENPE